MRSNPPPAQISMHSIPVGGSVGAAALIAILLLGMSLELSMQPAIYGMGAGLLGGLALIAFRR